MFRILSLFTICALVLASCASEKKNHFTVSGKISGMPSVLVALEELNFNGSVLIDTMTSVDGSFQLKGKFIEPNLYRVKMGDESLLVIIDSDYIRLNAKWDELQNYSATGSSGTSSLITFLATYFQFNKDLLAHKMALDSLLRKGSTDSLTEVFTREINTKSDELLTYLKHYSDTTKSQPLAIFIASKLLPYDEELPYLTELTASLDKRFAPTGLSKEFSKAVAERSKSLERLAQGPKIGTTAPDFTLTSVDGEEVKLSSFKGKYVLLDFWASWCPPCRAENPNVVAVYNQYKNENFDILAVSLDENAEKWKEAIAEDNLTWTHVSDLRGWNSGVAAAYGVQSIPTNFLIDTDGKIVAVNLRGDNLRKTLQRELSNSARATNETEGVDLNAHSQ